MRTYYNVLMLKSRKHAAFGDEKSVVSSVHTSVIARAKSNESKFKLLPHAPYSSD